MLFSRLRPGTVFWILCKFAILLALFVPGGGRHAAGQEPAARGEKTDPAVVQAWVRAGFKLYYVGFDPLSCHDPDDPARPKDAIPQFEARGAVNFDGLPTPKFPFALNLFPGEGAPLACKDLTRFATLVQLDISGNKVTDRDLEHLAKLENLAHFEANGSAITDRGVRALQPLQRLRSLSLTHCQVGDGAAEVIANFKELRVLSLAKTQIRNRGMQQLTRLPNLEELWLGGTLVSDLGLKEGLFGKLQRLGLNGCPVTDDGLRGIAKLANLRELDLDSTPITDAALAEVSGLPNLELLNISGVAATGTGFVGSSSLETLVARESRFSDEGAARLVHCKKLRTLHLTSTAVSDRCVAHLARIPTLEEVSLSATSVTSTGARRLNRTCPTVHFNRMYQATPDADLLAGSVYQITKVTTDRPEGVPKLELQVEISIEERVATKLKPGEPTTRHRLVQIFEFGNFDPPQYAAHVPRGVEDLMGGLENQSANPNWMLLRGTVNKRREKAVISTLIVPVDVQRAAFRRPSRRAEDARSIDRFIQYLIVTKQLDHARNELLRLLQAGAPQEMIDRVERELDAAERE